MHFMSLLGSSLSLICIFLTPAVIAHTDTTKINLNDYLQPSKITREEFESSDFCARNCQDEEEPRICYYYWFAESYDTLGPACGNCPQNTDDCNNPQCVPANGFEKSILTINRMVPGPTIEVCLGDRIIVDVSNHIPGSELTIHWHGVWQTLSQYSDGVPMATQCPIHEGQVFRYDFYANNEGTHYWHSHDGLQKLDGIQGSLIVRTPKANDPNGKLYDKDTTEHVLMLMDWMNTTAESRFPGTYHRHPGQHPEALLFQGKGRNLNSEDGKNSTFPYHQVLVQQNNRYRFRLVGGLCTVCGVQLTIENHTMTLISTDGSGVQPVAVDAVNVYSGERYDIVINANQTPGTYWIHMRGLGDCSEPRNQLYQLALLRYENSDNSRRDSPSYLPYFSERKLVLNPEKAACFNGTGICVSQLRDLSGSVPNSVLKNPPDLNIPMNFGFKKFTPEEIFKNNKIFPYFVIPDGSLMISYMNNISFMPPPSPLLSQTPEYDQSDLYCPVGSEGIPHCPTDSNNSSYCSCVSVMKIPIGTTVQIVLGDATPQRYLHHPFHLHGYAFFVLEEGLFRTGESLQSIADKFRNYTCQFRPALKDTIAVPNNGYSVIRFKVDNPGVWMFHCHFMYHLASGMAMIMQVGEKSDWLPTPPGFPQCGNYLPDIYIENS